MRYAVILLLLAAATPAAAQSRADQIAAEFTKSKNTTKTRHGVTARKYKEVVSQPWHADVRDYAGHYVSLGDPMVLDVDVTANGVVTARGKDEAAFEILDARIRDAVLYGTKVYRDGRRERFEAGFLKRSHRAAPDEAFTASYGIGVLVDAPRSTGITGALHVFLEKL
jgi:hypothetical protein